MTENKEFLENLQKTIIDGIQDRKGRSVTVVDMSDIEAAATSTFIIAEGTSPMQVSAVADSVRYYVLEHADVTPCNYDGYSNAEGIVIDYGSILVHIFGPDARQRYNLEELWSDAVITNVPDLD